MRNALIWAAVLALKLTESGRSFVLFLRANVLPMRSNVVAPKEEENEASWFFRPGPCWLGEICLAPCVLQWE